MSISKQRLKIANIVKDILAIILIILGGTILFVQTMPIFRSWLYGVFNTIFENTRYVLPVSSKFLQALAKTSYFDPGAAYMSVLARSTPAYLDAAINTKYKKDMFISIPAVGLRHVVVTPNVAGNNPREYEYALHKGVAHLKGTPLPGDGGVSIIYGHSGVRRILSRKLPHYLAFTLLEKVELGDEIIIERDNKMLKYIVTAKKIVKPYNLDFLSKLNSEIQQLALVTCWPIGLGSSRLVIIAQYYE